MEELISVIVPVYNVEEYLVECLESIINQTYRNLEIILVDDGATDSSGEICDRYAEKDNRIVVIHKKNGGLSDARNAGLAIASGNYIGFVDSDDAIEYDMYSTLYHLCRQNNVKLACARYSLFGEVGKMKVPEATGKMELLQGEDLLTDIFAGNSERFSSISVWDRLYHKDVLQGLSFPKGKCYEDVVFSTKAILNADRVAYVNRSLYRYRIRGTSISHGNKKDGIDPRLVTQRLPLQIEQIEYLETSGRKELANRIKAAHCLEIWNLIQSNTSLENEIALKKAVKVWRLEVTDILRFSLPAREKIKLLMMKAGIYQK